MCLIIGCVLSNVLTAGFPGAWVENRGFLCSLLLFWHLDQLGSFGGKAPYLQERRRNCAGVRSGTWSQKTEENGWVVCRESEFCRGNNNTNIEASPSNDPESVWKEDHVVVKCRVGSHTFPDSDRASHVNTSRSGLNPALIQTSEVKHWGKRGFGENVSFVLSHSSCLAWSCV